MPLPGWIFTFMAFCRAGAAALLLYAIVNGSVIIGALAVISILSAVAFYRKFQRQPTSTAFSGEADRPYDER
jgi:membrane protein implicated in regulation of membrane protease activity